MKANAIQSTIAVWGRRSGYSSSSSGSSGGSSSGGSSVWQGPAVEYPLGMISGQAKSISMTR